MSEPIKILADTKRVEEVMKSLEHVPEKAKTALSRALNASALSARTEVTRKAREKFQIQASRARNTIHISKASVSSDMPTAFVTSSEERQQITRFRISPKEPPSQKDMNNFAKRKKLKVRVSVKKGKNSLFKHAFLARFSSGHVGLYHRTKGLTRNKNVKLQEHYGPAVPQMIGGKAGAEAVAEIARQKFDAEFDRQVDLIFKE